MVRCRVLQVVGDENQAHRVRGSALAALGYFSDGDTAKELAAGFGDPILRLGAVRAMGRTADPRWTETADLADLHLPLRPGSDIALANGMLHVLWKEGGLDEGFMAASTSGWDDLRPVLSETYVHTWDIAQNPATGITVIDNNQFSYYQDPAAPRGWYSTPRSRQ